MTGLTDGQLGLGSGSPPPPTKGGQKRATPKKQVVSPILGPKFVTQHDNTLLNMISLIYTMLLSTRVTVANNVQDAGLRYVVKPIRRGAKVEAGIKCCCQFLLSIMILLFAGQSVALRLVPSGQVTNAAWQAVQGNWHLSLATITAVLPVTGTADALTGFMTNFVGKLALCAIVPVLLFGLSMFGVVFYAPRALLLIVLVIGCSWNFAMKDEITLGDHMGNKVLLPMNREHTGQCVGLRGEMSLLPNATLREILWIHDGHKARSASQTAYKTAMKEKVDGPREGCVRNQPSLHVAAWKSQSQPSQMQQFDPKDDKTSCGQINVNRLETALKHLCENNVREHMVYPEYEHSALNLKVDANTIKCLAKGQIEVDCPYNPASAGQDCPSMSNASLGGTETSALFDSTKYNAKIGGSTIEGNFLDDILTTHDEKWEKIYFQPMFLDSSGQLVSTDNIKGSGAHCAWHFCVEDIKQLRSDEDKQANKITRSWFMDWHSAVKVDKGALPTKPRHSSLAASKNYKPLLLTCLIGGVILFAMYKCKHQFESTEDDLPRVIFFIFFTVTMVMRLVG
jgi:hypothetical protein